MLVPSAGWQACTQETDSRISCTTPACWCYLACTQDTQHPHPHLPTPPPRPALVFLQHHQRDFARSISGHPVAWAFLRLSALEVPTTGPLDLKLQLYRYDTGAWLGGGEHGVHSLLRQRPAVCWLMMVLHALMS
jgi:hypothetical protein